MMEKGKDVTGQSLLEQGVWSSKSMWKAISSVAIGVFVITMIYAQFLSMAKDIEHLKETHKAEIKVLTERIQKQDARLVKADDDLEDALTHNSHEIVLLKLDAHEPGVGQKRIHR